MIQLLSKDGRASQHRQRFIAFRQPAGQVNKMGRKIALPALPFSRLTALRSLLSVALSSARLLDSITLAFFHPKWSRFQLQNGPVFDFNFNLAIYQLGLFSLLKWACFHLQKTPGCAAVFLKKNCLIISVSSNLFTISGGVERLCYLR